MIKRAPKNFHINLLLITDTDTDTNTKKLKNGYGYGYGYKKISGRIRIRIRMQKIFRADTDTNTDTIFVIFTDTVSVDGYLSRRIVLMLLIFYGQKVYTLKRTFIHDHSTIETTCTVSYVAIRPYVEFWYVPVYLKFSPSWNKTTRDNMRTSEMDLKILNLILYASESPKTTRIDHE